MTTTRVGFLGPEGSFSHEAVTVLGVGEPVAFPRIAEVLSRVASGELEAGLVPLENAIEGTVSATIDGMVFDHDLMIVAEVVLPIALHLVSRPGVALGELTRVASHSHALAQARGFLASLPSVELVETTSTSQAAADVAATVEPWAAVSSKLAAQLFGLEVLAENVADHSGNATRFVLVRRHDIAAPTGNDRTLIVCFQDDDRPGSLHSVLGRFAARDINLTKIESRPTKTGLGDYCFVVEFDGHIADDVVADCLADIQAHLMHVKFLGSYPVTGEIASVHRAEVSEARSEAAQWMQGLRSRIAKAN
jgi:prephenate dehydratase